MSVPQPIAAPSSASSAASPPELPPHVNVPPFRGLADTPQSGFAHSNASIVCGTFVFEMTMPPAARTCLTS
jgi:hypothetical protein